ncbi:patatin-like phospholipase family protein [Streptomyces sp. NPDC002643]
MDATGVRTDADSLRGPTAPTPPSRGLVLGCGGTLGAAWTIGALHSLGRALDWDPRDAEVLVGTSAGAELAAMLGSGVGVEELLAAQLGREGEARAELIRHFASPPRPLPPRPAAFLGSPGLAGRALADGVRGRRAEGARVPSSPRLPSHRVPVLAGLSGLLPQGRGEAGWLADLADFLTSDGGGSRGQGGGGAEDWGGGDARAEGRGGGDVKPGGAPRPGQWVRHRATWLIAADFDSGRRTVFGHPDSRPVALRDALRASWAVPGWFRPVRIDGRRYVDGGVLSTASADLLVPERLDEVYVIAPMSSVTPHPRKGLGRAEALLRRPMTRTLDAECAALRATGTEVVRIEPTAADLEVMGGNFMDGRRRLTVLETSLRTTRAVVRALCRPPTALPAHPLPKPTGPGA